MKYKYSRKECNKEIETIKRIFSGSQIMPGGWLETVTQYLHATQLMLLAQKEDRKECKHIPDREVGLNVWSCKKCRCCFVHKSTPSPLEGFVKIKEIDYMEHDLNPNKKTFDQDAQNWFADLEEKVNQLISNQKKLYQFIKEKL